MPPTLIKPQTCMRSHAVMFPFKNQTKQARCFSGVLSREHHGSAFSCCQFGNKVNTHWACALLSSPTPLILPISRSLCSHMVFTEWPKALENCSMRNNCPDALMESKSEQDSKRCSISSISPSHTHTKWGPKCLTPTPLAFLSVLFPYSFHSFSPFPPLFQR